MQNVLSISSKELSGDLAGVTPGDPIELESVSGTVKSVSPDGMVEIGVTSVEYDGYEYDCDAESETEEPEAEGEEPEMEKPVKSDKKSKPVGLVIVTPKK